MTARVIQGKKLNSITFSIRNRNHWKGQLSVMTAPPRPCACTPQATVITIFIRSNSVVRCTTKSYNKCATLTRYSSVSFGRLKGVNVMGRTLLSDLSPSCDYFRKSHERLHTVKWFVSDVRMLKFVWVLTTDADIYFDGKCNGLAIDQPWPSFF